MVEFIRVTARTPKGDTKEYSWMGDMNEANTQQDFVKFLIQCCDDTADFFGCPDDWDPQKWRDYTCASFESVTDDRDFSVGISPFVR